jgi:hypothetical protein
MISSEVSSYDGTVHSEDDKYQLLGLGRTMSEIDQSLTRPQEYIMTILLRKSVKLNLGIYASRDVLRKEKYFTRK